MDSFLKHYLKDLKLYGQKNNIPNVSATLGQFLNMMIQLKKPQRILEIGSANGYSTLWMAEAAREVGAQIYTIDHSAPTFKALQENLNQTGFNDVVIPHFGKALEVMAHFPEDMKFDFVFVDGEKASYLDFWKAIEPKLSPKSIILFDDMIAFSEKTKAFSEHLESLQGFSHMLLPIDGDDGVVLMMKI